MSLGALSRCVALYESSPTARCPFVASTPRRHPERTPSSGLNQCSRGELDRRAELIRQQPPGVLVETGRDSLRAQARAGVRGTRRNSIATRPIAGSPSPLGSMRTEQLAHSGVSGSTPADQWRCTAAGPVLTRRKERNGPQETGFLRSGSYGLRSLWRGEFVGKARAVADRAG